MRSAMKLGICVLCMLAITVIAGPRSVKAADLIKIGVIYPLTGGAAAEGRELRAGAELALEISNKVYQNISMNMANSLRSRSKTTRARRYGKPIRRSTPS